MPAESEAQRGFLYATKGEAWVKKHHFDNAGKLPKRVKKNSTKTQVKEHMDKLSKGLRT